MGRYDNCFFRGAAFFMNKMYVILLACQKMEILGRRGGLHEIPSMVGYGYFLELHNNNKIIFGHGWQCTMVKSAIHTMASHHNHNAANHGETWLAVKNRGTMVNLIAE